jgi:hypothetical protein
MWWRKLLVILGVFVLLIGGVLLYLRHLYNVGTLQEYLTDRVLDKVNPPDVVGVVTSTQAQNNFIKQLLGFDQPQTYLLLFLNNTELRPGGGFIGSYGVVKVDKAIPHVIKTDGTEVLDLQAPQNFVSTPPAPLATYLGIKQWGLRDSNWLPDFASSTRTTLDLYSKEQGVEAQHITTVVGFTPTVMEELLKITGPIVINGEEYTSSNFTEKLEYEVEYGFSKKGIEQGNRKDIIGELAHILVGKISGDLFRNWAAYLELGTRMLNEKQVLVYSLNPEEQKIISQKKWSGELNQTYLGDSIMWVDANLGALKTDAALTRALTYKVELTPTGYVGVATMHYTHRSPKDWRTSRYLTYTRLYVPTGSKLLGVQGAVKNALGDAKNPVDQGIELGHQWFGTFFTVEPQSQGELSFRFQLSPEVVEQIKKGTYSLMVQKQLGTVNHTLTLDLGFDRRVATATPGEDKSKWGDTKYSYQTDLRVDREFNVSLVP